MDPDATLAIGLDSTAEFASRVEAFKNLLLWIQRGGWLPTAWTDMSRTEAASYCETMVRLQ
jgi:hypothetical protein